MEKFTYEKKRGARFVTEYTCTDPEQVYSSLARALIRAHMKRSTLFGSVSFRDLHNGFIEITESIGGASGPVSARCVYVVKEYPFTDDEEREV